MAELIYHPLQNGRYVVDVVGEGSATWYAPAGVSVIQEMVFLGGAPAPWSANPNLFPWWRAFNVLLGSAGGGIQFENGLCPVTNSTGGIGSAELGGIPATRANGGSGTPLTGLPAGVSTGGHAASAAYVPLTGEVIVAGGCGGVTAWPVTDEGALFPEWDYFYVSPTRDAGRLSPIPMPPNPANPPRRLSFEPRHGTWTDLTPGLGNVGGPDPDGVNGASITGIVNAWTSFNESSMEGYKAGLGGGGGGYGGGASSVSYYESWETGYAWQRGESFNGGTASTFDRPFNVSPGGPLGPGAPNANYYGANSTGPNGTGFPGFWSFSFLPVGSPGGAQGGTIWAVGAIPFATTGTEPPPDPGGTT